MKNHKGYIISNENELIQLNKIVQHKSSYDFEKHRNNIRNNYPIIVYVHYDVFNGWDFLEKQSEDCEKIIDFKVELRKEKLKLLNQLENE